MSLATELPMPCSSIHFPPVTLPSPTTLSKLPNLVTRDPLLLQHGHENPLHLFAKLLGVLDFSPPSGLDRIVVRQSV